MKGSDYLGLFAVIALVFGIIFAMSAVYHAENSYSYGRSGDREWEQIYYDDQNLAFISAYLSIALFCCATVLLITAVHYEIKEVQLGMREKQAEFPAKKEPMAPPQTYYQNPPPPPPPQ